ncbi:MAG: ABC transporter substrate-binding protein [Oscillospiraceae bacterium]
MNKKKLLCVALCGAMLLGAVGCSSGEKDEKQMDKITISEVTHSIFYAPMYAAVNNGYFAENNIEPQLINAGGADKVMTAVLTDAADIGFAGPEAVIYVYAQGKKDYPKVFAQLTQCDGSFLIGREKNPNFKWTDLKGSTILPGRKGGIPYMTLLFCINQNGMEVGKDVFFEDSIQFNAMTGAFISGQGDYVTVFEPGATDLEKQGKGYVMASVGEEGGNVPYTTYFASDKLIKENPELIDRFTAAIYKGQNFVEASTAKEVAKAIAPSFPETDIATIQAVVQRYKDIGAYSASPVMTQESFERLCDILTNAGELKSEVEYSAIIDDSFAKAVLDK